MPMIAYVKDKYKEIDLRYAKHTKVMRFIIAGGTATAVNFFLLYLFTDLIHVWYLYSSILAFFGSFVVSFGLQKFWTFRDRSRDDLHKQALLYLLTIFCGLGINTLIIYSLVEYASLHYLVGQFVGSAAVAVLNYFIYAHFIFEENVL